ncbi:MAG: hypothetical protein RLZZ419_1507 [Pseudomonadota bacterium]
MPSGNPLVHISKQPELNLLGWTVTSIIKLLNLNN